MNSRATHWSFRRPGPTEGGSANSSQEIRDRRVGPLGVWSSSVPLTRQLVQLLVAHPSRRVERLVGEHKTDADRAADQHPNEAAPKGIVSFHGPEIATLYLIISV